MRPLSPSRTSTLGMAFLIILIGGTCDTAIFFFNLFSPVSCTELSNHLRISSAYHIHFLPRSVPSYVSYVCTSFGVYPTIWHLLESCGRNNLPTEITSFDNSISVRHVCARELWSNVRPTKRNDFPSTAAPLP